MWGDAGLQTNINTTSQNIQIVIPGEGIAKTFQENKPIQELLEHGSVKTMMISPVRYSVHVLQRYDKGILSHWANTYVANLGVGVNIAH